MQFPPQPLCVESFRQQLGGCLAREAPRTLLQTDEFPQIVPLRGPYYRHSIPINEELPSHIGTRVPSNPAHSRGTTLLSGIPLTLQGYVFIPPPLITGGVPGQVYSGHTSGPILVGGSGRIFSGAFVSSSHHTWTLCTSANRLLVSIVAFYCLK